MSDDASRVKERVSIVDIVGRRVQLKKAGKNFLGLCPFHNDKSASLNVTPSTGRYRCFACGAGGDVFNFVMETEKVEFREALRMLAEEAGITLSIKQEASPDAAQKEHRIAIMKVAQKFFQEQLLSSPLAKDYCKERGLDAKTIETWGLGFGPDHGESLTVFLKKKGYNLEECRDLFLVKDSERGGFYDRFRSRLTFPIYDERSNLVAFGGRIIGDGKPKYINSGDTPLYSKREVLYGMNKARNAMGGDGKAVLVEGYLDVIACHRAGVTTAVASLGTSLSEEHARLLKRWAKEVIILYDADSAGQKAAARAEEILSEVGLRVKISLMPEGEDPDTVLRKLGPDHVKRSVEGGLSPVEFKLGLLKSTISPSEEAFWPQAFDILSKTEHELELERLSGELTGYYPGIRDPIAAQAAIRKEVLKRRRKQVSKKQTDADPGPVERRAISKTGFDPREGAIFRGLITEGISREAWGLIFELPFMSPVAKQLVAELKRAFPEGPTDSRSDTWLGDLPADVKDALLQIELKSMTRLRPEDFQRAISGLIDRHRRIEKEKERKQPESEIITQHRGEQPYLHSFEMEILRALSDPQFADFALPAVKESLFFSEEGVKIEMEIAKVLEKSEDLLPKDWLSRLPSEISAPIDAILLTTLIKQKTEIVKETVERLRQKSQQRELDRMKLGDPDLAQIQKTLQDMKNRQDR